MKDEHLQELAARAYGLAHKAQFRADRNLEIQRDAAFAELFAYEKRMKRKKQTPAERAAQIAEIRQLLKGQA